MNGITHPPIRHTPFRRALGQLCNFRLLNWTLKRTHTNALLWPKFSCGDWTNSIHNMTHTYLEMLKIFATSNTHTSTVITHSDHTNSEYYKRKYHHYKSYVCVEYMKTANKPRTNDGLYLCMSKLLLLPISHSQYPQQTTNNLPLRIIVSHFCTLIRLPSMKTQKLLIMPVSLKYSN